LLFSKVVNLGQGILLVLNICWKFRVVQEHLRIGGLAETGPLERCLCYMLQTNLRKGERAHTGARGVMWKDSQSGVHISDRGPNSGCQVRCADSPAAIVKQTGRSAQHPCGTGLLVEGLEQDQMGWFSSKEERLKVEMGKKIRYVGWEVGSAATLTKTGPWLSLCRVNKLQLELKRRREYMLKGAKCLQSLQHVCGNKQQAEGQCCLLPAFCYPLKFHFILWDLAFLELIVLLPHTHVFLYRNTQVIRR
jgi:hypothetical protein